MVGRSMLGWLLVVVWGTAVDAAPFLEGTVVDEQGRPIAGASVTIFDCIGTCFGGKTVLTSSEGRYVFEQKPFRNFPFLSILLPGRYEVSRQQTGPKLSEPDTETPRRADFVLGTPAAAYVRLVGTAPPGWKQTLAIRPGRDAKVDRYEVAGHQLWEGAEWTFETLPRNENLHFVVTREPIVEKTADPAADERRKKEIWREQIEIVSAPVRLPDPQRYRIEARLEAGPDGEPSIVLASLRDALSADRTKELAVADPMFGPPVDAPTREAALALLKRVETGAAPWNARVPASIRSYAYDVVTDKGTTHVEVDRDAPESAAWETLARQRGFAYMPPLRWIFSQPDNVTFHGVQIGGEEGVLHYRLKSPRGLAVGIGVGPWHGFRTSRFSAGRITIDLATATVREHRYSSGLLGKETVETFGDYVAVGDGFAPRSLAIRQETQDWRFAFRIHNDALWLLDHATGDDPEPPVYHLDNVTVQLREK